jgi:hypothetical protein
VVVAGAGFGKSTLAARTAATRRSAWYTLDGPDRHIGTLGGPIRRCRSGAVPASRAGSRRDRRGRHRRLSRRPGPDPNLPRRLQGVRDAGCQPVAFSLAGPVDDVRHKEDHPEMDDLVNRLIRELPDTSKDRYDIAYQRGRSQARSSLLFSGFAIGLAAGGLAVYLLDPRLGHGRRVELGQRLGAMGRDLQRTVGGRGKDLRNRAAGTAAELGLPGTPPTNAERRDGLAGIAGGRWMAPLSAGAHLGSVDDAHEQVEPVAAGSAPLG